MTQRYDIQRVANIMATDRENAVFYEIHTLFSVDGIEKRHRDADLAFKTYKEAENWVTKQSK
jgi:hypothetical protein